MKTLAPDAYKGDDYTEEILGDDGSNEISEPKHAKEESPIYENIDAVQPTVVFMKNFQFQISIIKSSFGYSMSDKGEEEDLPATRHSMVSTSQCVHWQASMENVEEGKKFKSLDGICTSQPVQTLYRASTVVVEEVEENSADGRCSRKQNGGTEFDLKEYCGMLYDHAGSLVKEPEEQITMEKYGHLLNDEVGVFLNQVLDEHPLPFMLQDFQKLAIHALGRGHNVILMSPTGSGKMVVVYLAILVLQKVNSQPGVGVGTQPLNSIMQEKLKQPYISTGVISMKGDVQSSSECGEQEDDVVLTDPVEDFKSGKIKCMIGHAESWISGAAQEILDSLQEKDQILLTFVDESHIILSSHWESFRHQLKLVPGLLRGRARRGAPCLAMTATLTPGEIKELESSLGFRTNTVILIANPIQEHHKYIR